METAVCHTGRCLGMFPLFLGLYVPLCEDKSRGGVGCCKPAFLRRRVFAAGAVLVLLKLAAIVHDSTRLLVCVG